MDPSQIGKPTAPRQIDPNSPYLMHFNQKDLSELSRLYQEGMVGGDLRLACQASRLVSRNSSMRSHLEPILRAASEEFRAELDTFRLVASVYPKVITHARWARMTNPEKYAVHKKVAHQPLLKGQGLTKGAVRAGNAFMIYMLVPSENKSKFYEGLIREEDGGYRVLFRWGRMTDSGQTGRIDGGKFDNDPRFWAPDLESAQAILNKKYKAKTDKGYIDAFGPKHREPDGHKLPLGRYPVGLGGAGFWGKGQSIHKCILGLKQLEDALSQARSEILATGSSVEVKEHLQDAKTLLETETHIDSTLGRQLVKKIKRTLSRLSGSPRFLPDPEGRALAAELFTISRLVRKQTSHCQ